MKKNRTARAKAKVAERPAESITLLAGAVVAILAAAGVSIDETAVVAILLGITALPAFVTGLVNRSD